VGFVQWGSCPIDFNCFLSCISYAFDDSCLIDMPPGEENFSLVLHFNQIEIFYQKAKTCAMVQLYHAYGCFGKIPHNMCSKFKHRDFYCNCQVNWEQVVLPWEILCYLQVPVLIQVKSFSDLMSFSYISQCVRRTPFLVSFEEIFVHSYLKRHSKEQMCKRHQPLCCCINGTVVKSDLSHGNYLVQAAGTYLLLVLSL